MSLLTQQEPCSTCSHHAAHALGNAPRASSDHCRQAQDQAQQHVWPVQNAAACLPADLSACRTMALVLTPHASRLRDRCSWSCSIGLLECILLLCLVRSFKVSLWFSFVCNKVPEVLSKDPETRSASWKFCLFVPQATQTYSQVAFLTIFLLFKLLPLNSFEVRFFKLKLYSYVLWSRVALPFVVQFLHEVAHVKLGKLPIPHLHHY